MSSKEWRYDKNRVLDMWTAGMTCRAICAALGMARPEAVSVIIQRARQIGDDRAVARGKSRRDRAPYPAYPEAKITRDAINSITVPEWVPEDLAFLYRVFAKTRGHDGAAAYVRGRMGAA